MTRVMLPAASRPTPSTTLRAGSCKKRKDGATTFRYGKRRTEDREGWASPPTARNSHGTGGAQIPPFKKRRVGHPAASNIPTLNFAKNAKFRMGHPAVGFSPRTKKTAKPYFRFHSYTGTECNSLKGEREWPNRPFPRRLS